MRMQKKVYKVFLTGYSTQNLTNRKLEEALRGKVEGFVSAAIPSKSYQGYAFIQVRDKASLQILLKKKKVMVNGERFLIKPYKKGKALGKFKESVVQRKVFLHNIPLHWNNTKLFQLFSKFGAVEDAFICKNVKEAGHCYRDFHLSSKNKGRNIGFVVFKNKIDARDVCSLQKVHFLNEFINVEPAMVSKNEARKIERSQRRYQHRRTNTPELRGGYSDESIFIKKHKAATHQGRERFGEDRPPVHQSLNSPKTRKEYQADAQERSHREDRYESGWQGHPINKGNYKKKSKGYSFGHKSRLVGREGQFASEKKSSRANFQEKKRRGQALDKPVFYYEEAPYHWKELLNYFNTRPTTKRYYQLENKFRVDFRDDENYRFNKPRSSNSSKSSKDSSPPGGIRHPHRTRNLWINQQLQLKF